MLQLRIIWCGECAYYKHQQCEVNMDSKDDLLTPGEGVNDLTRDVDSIFFE